MINKRITKQELNEDVLKELNKIKEVEDKVDNMNASVKSVNGKTGNVKLTAEDIEIGRFGQTVKDAILDNSIDTEEIESEMHNEIKAINLQMEYITKYNRKTYAELLGLKNNNELQEGKRYILTDYRTKYKQPDTNVIKEMEVEELILTASSNNTFEPVVYSFKYPQDTIWYDFDNNKCEDNKTPRNGFITRRYDHISGNDCPQDWRTMLWARWCPDENQYYKNGKLVDYEIWEQGQEVDTGVVYKANDKLLIAKCKGVPHDAEDMYIFDNVYYDIGIGILRVNEKILTYSDFVEDEIRLKLGKLHERKTFDEGCAFNIIKSNTTEHVLHNNVFGEECKYNKLGSDCYDNTFEKYNYYNILDNACYNNLLQRGSNFNYFICTSYHNVLTDECKNNYFSNGSNNNILGNDCYNNFIDNSSDNSMFFNSNNNVLSNCNNNVFYNNGKNNIIMNCSHSKINAYSKNLFVKQLKNKNMLGIQEFKNPSSCNVIEPNKNGDYVYSVINANNNIEFITIP